MAGYGIGSIASLPIFYGAQGQQTYEKVYKAQIEAGATPEIAAEEARKAGHLSGGIEAGGELVSDIIPLHGLAKPFTKPLAKAAGNIVKDTFFPGLKGAAKGILKTEVGEIGTEMAQQAGEDEVESAYGVGPGATWEETNKVVMPTALMTLIPGAAGAAAHRMQAKRNAALLEDPATPADQRAKIALGAASVMQKASPDTAKAFSTYASEQIKNGAPIQIGNDSIYHDFAQTKTGATPTSDPITGPVANIGAATSVDEAISAAQAGIDNALNTHAGRREKAVADMARQSDQALMGAEFTPNAMQLAMERARAKTVPSPSWPKSFSPHAHTAPSLRNAMEWRLPAATALNTPVS